MVAMGKGVLRLYCDPGVEASTSLSSVPGSAGLNLILSGLVRSTPPVLGAGDIRGPWRFDEGLTGRRQSDAAVRDSLARPSVVPFGIGSDALEAYL
jgi:hypothetical protein